MKMHALAALALLPALLYGCKTATPRLMEGDALGALVNYEASDLVAATAVANRHCARFERVAKYQNTVLDVASFACIRR